MSYGCQTRTSGPVHPIGEHQQRGPGHHLPWGRPGDARQRRDRRRRNQKAASIAAMATSTRDAIAEAVTTDRAANTAFSATIWNRTSIALSPAPRRNPPIRRTLPDPPSGPGALEQQRQHQHAARHQHQMLSGVLIRSDGQLRPVQELDRPVQPWASGHRRISNIRPRPNRRAPLRCAAKLIGQDDDEDHVGEAHQDLDHGQAQHAEPGLRSADPLHRIHPPHQPLPHMCVRAIVPGSLCPARHAQAWSAPVAYAAARPSRLRGIKRAPCAGPQAANIPTPRKDIASCRARRTALLTHRKTAPPARS